MAAESRNKQQNAFRRLRSVLVSATQLELGQLNSFNVSDHSLQHSFLPEQSQIYSNILLLIALKCLTSSNQNGCMQKELDTFGKRDVFQLTSNELRSASADLYWQVRDFWQDKLSDLIPQPTQLGQQTINVLKNLSDPELIGLWKDPCTVGYAYQFLSSPTRKKAQVEIQSSNKQLPLRKLISFTQIYTPDWIVDYLLVNCVVAQWKKAEQKKFPFLLKAPDEEMILSRSVEELTVLDPACGSGHFIVRALDCLLDLYESERIERITALRHILANCLAGVDVDLFGLWTTATALLVRCLRETAKVDFRIHSLTHSLPLRQSTAHGSLLGSLSRNWPATHPLHKRFTAVVTNPPYIGRKLMSRDLKAELAQEYPDCHHDLCAPFIKRGLELLAPDGRLGLITQASLLYLPSYTKLRQQIVERYHLLSVIEVGPGVFPLQGGEKVNSMLMVIQKPDTNDRLKNSQNQAIFANIVQSPDKVHALSATTLDANSGTDKNCFKHNPSIFIKTDRCAFTYSCPSEILELLDRAPELSSMAEVRQGLATSDNARFVREWWQVRPHDWHKGWVPYVKGAGGSRWYSPIKHVINWHNNGADIKNAVAEAYPYLKGNIGWVVKNEHFYFRPGLCFSFVSSRDLAVRRLPAGCIFDVGASALFADTGDENFLLGYLNSSFINAIAKLLNPTINFQVGDIKKLPMLYLSSQDRSRLAALANDCFQLKQTLVQYIEGGLQWEIPEEVFPIFHGKDPVKQGSSFYNRMERTSTQLARLEDSINQIVLSNVEKNIDTKSSAVAIRNWIDSASESKVANITEFCRNSFANNILRHCIKQSLGVNKGEDSSSGLLIMPTNQCHLIYAILGLPGNNWWEKLVGLSLNVYLMELSNKPKTSSILPYFCHYLPASQSFLLGRSQDFANTTFDEIAWAHNRAIWSTIPSRDNSSWAEHNNEVLAQAENEARAVLARL